MHAKVSAFLSRRSNRSIVREYQRQQRGPWTYPGSYRRVTGKRLFEAAKVEVAHLSLRSGPCHEYHHTVRITFLKRAEFGARYAR